MSDHYYGIVHIDGPNADAAEKSARDMTKDVPHDIPTDQLTPDQAKLPWVLNEKAPDGSWACGQWRLSGPGFFTWQAWGGRKTVEFVQELSTTFPTDVFDVQISGPVDGDSFQGLLTIKNGIVSDVHTECNSCGRCQEHDPCKCDTPPSRGALLWWNVQRMMRKAYAWLTIKKVPPTTAEVFDDPEDISMEDVLGAGTHKQTATEKETTAF